MARSALLNVMVQAATKAGRSLTRDFGEVQHLQVSIKSPSDYVTRADDKAEKIIRSELLKARSTYGFLSKRGEAVKGTDGTHRWIVNSLDGTINFLHGLPFFAVSIALERGGELVAAVVYNPASDELFTAEKGGGAYLNDRRLRVAGRKKLVDSIIGCDIMRLGLSNHGKFLIQLANVMGEVSSVRCFGAASLDMAYLAAGHIDGFWKEGLSPWNIAAGIVLVREAGGFSCDISGGSGMLENGSVVAGNEYIQKALSTVIARPAPKF